MNAQLKAVVVPAKRRIVPSHPPSNVLVCRDRHLSYLCEYMRPDEIHQYLALTGAKTYDYEVAARGFMNLGGMKFVVMMDDGFTPAAAGGYSETLPGVWDSWMVGSTEGWAQQWRAITKTTLWLMDGLFELGARRLQTNALAERTAAIEWYERSLGLQREGTWRAMGRDGQDVACFSRIKREQI